MSDFDPPHGNWGALYPLPAGIIQAGGIKRDMVSSSVITASGKEDILEAINDFDKYIDTINIILTSSSATAAFLVLEWNITMKGSEEEPL